MASIDPTVVRGFLDGIEQARGTGSNALAALLRVDAAAPATAETLARVDSSAAQLATFSAQLAAATHLAAPRAAAEAAIDMSMLGVGEAEHHISQLRSLLVAGPTDPAAAVAHATAARGALDRLLDDEFEHVAQLASHPGDGDAAVLGVAGDDGAWRSFGELADEELAGAVARVGDPEADARALIDELDDTMRVADEHIRDGARGTSAFDEEIAAHDMAAELDRPDAAAQLAGTGTSAAVERDAQLDVIARSAPRDVHGGEVPSRTDSRATSLRNVRVSGSGGLLDHLPRRGEHLATAQVGRFEGGRVHELEVPLVATGTSVVMPTRAAALEGAKLDPTARWLVMPNHDSGWTLAKVGFAGTNAQEAVDLLHYGGGGLSGVRQHAAHIDTIVDKGSQLAMTTPANDAATEALRRPIPDDLRSLAQVHRLSPGTHGLPEAGSPVLRLESPDAQGAVGTVAHEFGVLVDGPRTDALLELQSIVMKRHLAGVHAVVRLDAGRYAVVNLEGVSGSSARSLAKGITPDAINPNFSHDVEAVMAGSRHRWAALDLRTGRSPF
jgi:hypothetical protein